MYKLFENHVYTAHSVVARKVLDKDKADTKKGSSGSTNTSTTGALRINDEITIIPQTARHDSSDQNVCRPSRGEKRSRVDIIDLSDDEDNKDGLTLPKSQVTITKVPAPKGYLSRNSRESMSKRSRADDNDTEWIIFLGAFVSNVLPSIFPFPTPSFEAIQLNIGWYECEANILMKQNSETIQDYLLLHIWISVYDVVWRKI